MNWDIALPPGMSGCGGAGPVRTRTPDYRTRTDAPPAQPNPKFLGNIAAKCCTKPDNLGIAREDDWWDLFAAFALGDHFTLTAAYTDLGTIAIADEQRGGLLSLQAAF